VVFSTSQKQKMDSISRSMWEIITQTIPESTEIKNMLRVGNTYESLQGRF